MFTALPALMSVLVISQVSVTVDTHADAHPISPLIYGANFPTDGQLASGAITAMRWGGNTTTVYNYQLDLWNSGADWYFENVAGCMDLGCSAQPANPQTNSFANRFLAQAAANNVVALFTVPTMGWVANVANYSHPFKCACPRSRYPNQDAFDPWDPECGNGKWQGVQISCDAQSTLAQTIDSTWNAQWASDIVTRFGASNGKRIYALDNEPNLWSSSHPTMHPSRLTYDELWAKMQASAVAVLNADPTAEVAGPAEWGWPNYFCSDADVPSQGCDATSPDRAAHGGEELMAWLLDQARAYEQQHGQRILHYFDLHYYPAGGNAPDTTRSLWDPTYVDPSWINDTIRLIPRMHEWVDQHYPGTKLAISEYDFDHHDEPVGAVTYADVLGIFGRERVDLATAWSAPLENEVAFAAYKLYRNFDGAGGHFEQVSVRATSSNADNIAAYAAIGPTRLTVAVINKAPSSQTVQLSLGTFATSGTAKVYVRGTGSAIVRASDLTVSSGAASLTLPGEQIAMVVMDGTAELPIDGGTIVPGTDAGTVIPGTDGGARPPTSASDGGLTPPPAPGVDGPGDETSVRGTCAVAPFSTPALSLLVLAAARVLRRRR